MHKQALNTDLFLDDFEAEARAHLDTIEASFLDVQPLVHDPKLMNSVFRTAHSIKGTAGFFFLEKIVAVAHELESVLSQIKDGNLIINDDITDVVLQSVDCLRDLVDNIHADEAIDTTDLIETLRKYSNIEIPQYHHAEDISIPFNYEEPETEKALKKALRFGNKVYYVNLGFNRGLGKYFKHPAIMIDSILSIGAILEAIVNDDNDDIIREQDPSVLTAKIVKALALHDTSTLQLLVTSVLEFELFSIATEIDKKSIHLLPQEAIFGASYVEKNAYGSSAEQRLGEEGGTIGAPYSDTFALETATVDAGAGDLPRKGTSPPYAKNAARGSGNSVRLDISAITGLVDLANEMILARNRLNSVVTEHRKEIAGIMPILHEMHRLTGEIHERVVLTRMQPISVLFSRFPRIIRDTAKLLKKDIEIEIFGNDVMLDKYLLDSLSDPLAQIIRNSADHGIESAERREKLGKPKKGKITLNAYMRDGSAIVEVIDDGAGIDMEALKSKGFERGILTEEILETMPESDILALIFGPGFSTAKKVTNISGRGFGMDIVKTNIEKSGGVIEIESEVDKGTTIRLKMPLTLSVLRVLIVSIDSVRYAVPEISVERIVRLRRSMPSRRLEKLNNSLVLVFDGNVIPVVTMAEIDAKSKGLAPPDDATIERSLEREVHKCLLLKSNDRVFALLIDDALESEQTLVKPLPEYLKDCPCYSNVTVLGNGNAVAILDAEGILRLMGIEGAQREVITGEYDSDEGEEKQYVVFKCSGSEFYAVEISEISRIETIDALSVQEMGKGKYVNAAGETIRIVRPEAFVPVRKRRYNRDKLYLLKLKAGSPPTGLLAGEVLDKVSGNFTIDSARLHNEHIHGTSTLGEKILIFLNTNAIAESGVKS